MAEATGVSIFAIVIFIGAGIMGLWLPISTLPNQGHYDRSFEGLKIIYFSNKRNEGALGE
ncbi:MAG: hypothetical protein U5K84_04040 [Alkalibacterium sp.]|nr:hypothetical protein [Alkalibacterium sp.]